MDIPGPARLSELALERVGLGIFAVDRDYRIVLWNRFMDEHSGLPAAKAIGCSFFDCFPDLPRAWLKRKFDTVFLLHSGSFSSWQHRPWLLPFEHDCPITGSLDLMQQDCAFMPLIENGEVVAVCVTIADVTELAVAWKEREVALEALRDSSERDALTGLYNRRHVDRRLQAEYNSWTRHQDAFAVLLFDIDHFKRINDTYGHPMGDAVLRKIAATVSPQLRNSDVVGRYGGEEFIVILPHCDEVGAAVVGEKIRAAIENDALDVSTGPLNVTVSVGGSVAYDGLTNVAALVSEADRALYDAKHGGRNQVCIVHTHPA
ncbi:MAG TPA: diguanylate cyclase [Trinickia sp.]|uniref:GGDEF domain-containing protein n=1 Tax=Trinickia sp. TaxID=2571163 RepID=UPI002BA148BA|nr:diguanylate cyclase [Trinickia sp.]HVW52889.1 diguanylate cyclase [Trinickia sp.]